MLSEVENAYRRAKKILRNHGCRLFLDISPADFPTLPYSAYKNIGIGAATALWRGMHSKEMQDCPFEKDWPISAFWLAGFEYRTEMIAKGIYLA